jgi:glycyl-tRNA synthetase
VGIKPDRLRFRQHKEDEMAHYAQDCWDAEVRTTYGWIECVGHAHRSAYDLKVHTDASKIELLAYESFDTPRNVKKLVVKPNKPKIGQQYKGEAKFLLDYLCEVEKVEKKALDLQAQLAKGPVKIKDPKSGKEFQVDSQLVEVKVEETKENGRRYIPNIIEPSFGIGRIIYSLLEQSYYLRPEEDQPEEGETKGVLRAVLQLPPAIAPVKVAILPLSTDKKLLAPAQELVKTFVSFNLTPRLDDSGVGIGKKYARADELGIPYDVTIDFQSLEDKTVTVRERDSTQQIRVTMRDVSFVVAQLITQTITWEEAYNTYPRQVHK